MISQEEGEFYIKLRDDISRNPKWMLSAMQAINRGIDERLRLEQHQRTEWETIAFNAMDARLFGKNKNWLAQKIDSLRDGASFKWDFIVERLQK